MSLILDALRKSDHARARNATERLRDGPSIAHASRLPSSAFFLLLAVIVLAAAAVIVALTIDHVATRERVETTGSERAPKTAAVRALGMETVSRGIETPVLESPAPAVTTVAPPVQALTADELAAPPFSSLSAEMRGRLPSLHVDIHAWAEDPDARFVLINLKRYQEGDRLAEGPLVRHILRDGVVLEFEGTLFSLSRR